MQANEEKGLKPAAKNFGLCRGFDVGGQMNQRPIAPAFWQPCGSGTGH